MSSTGQSDKKRNWKGRNRFLLRNKEKLKMNQYWYSADTLAAMVEEIEQHAKKVAFLSTPSVYFSLGDKKLQENSKLFDFDETAWGKHSSFVFYDFHKPNEIPSELHHTFDYVVVDPPFITTEVWDLYAQACKLLLIDDPSSPSAHLEDGKDGMSRSKVLLSTIVEHEAFLRGLLGTHACKFQPSIPNLIYQYNFYVNYPAQVLSRVNPEIDSYASGKKGLDSDDDDNNTAPKLSSNPLLSLT